MTLREDVSRAQHFPCRLVGKLCINRHFETMPGLGRIYSDFGSR